MGIPQMIFLGITFLGLGLNMAQHGKPKEGKENFFIALAARGIAIGLLCWGGFFS